MGPRVTRSFAVFTATLVLICLGARPVNPPPDGTARTVSGPAASAAAATRLLPPAPCPAIAPTEVAEGRRIFSGAGNCYTCHGPDAKGTPLGPDLHAHKWLNISGSYASIDSLITAGVAHPKEHPAPMPAKGGANLNADQVCDVAAYVYSLSHPQGS